MYTYNSVYLYFTEVIMKKNKTLVLILILAHSFISIHTSRFSFVRQLGNGFRQTVKNYSMQKIKEDPRSFCAAGVGGFAGGVVSGEGIIKTTVGVLSGAYLARNALRNRRSLAEVKEKVSWIRQHGATKKDVDTGFKEVHRNFNCVQDDLQRMANTSKQQLQEIEQTVVCRVDTAEKRIIQEFRNGFKNQKPKPSTFSQDASQALKEQDGILERFFK